MSQCRYRIKDARDIGWFVCQREEGHPADGPDDGHRAALPCMSRGDRTRPLFEGIWHLPGEKSTADPEPAPAPAVVSIWTNTRPPQVLKEATSNSTEVRSTK